MSLCVVVRLGNVLTSKNTPLGIVICYVAWLLLRQTKAVAENLLPDNLLPVAMSPVKRQL